MQDSANDNRKILIEAFGEIIKECRESKGKSIYGISAEAAMSKSTWRDVEACAFKDIKLTTIWKIAEGLEIPPAKIFEKLNKKLGKNFSLSDSE